MDLAIVEDALCEGGGGAEAEGGSEGYSRVKMETNKRREKRAIGRYQGHVARCGSPFLVLSARVDILLLVLEKTA